MSFLYSAGVVQVCLAISNVMEDGLFSPFTVELEGGDTQIVVDDIDERQQGKSPLEQSPPEQSPPEESPRGTIASGTIASGNNRLMEQSPGGIIASGSNILCSICTGVC